MIFSKLHKDLIKDINKGKFDNLKSMVEYYFGKPCLKYSLLAIEKRKKQDYEDRKKEIDPYLDSFIGQDYEEISYTQYPNSNSKEYTSTEIEDCRRKLNDYSINEDDFLLKFDLDFEVDDINLTTQAVYEWTPEIDKKMNAFIDVCEYLVDGGLIKLVDQKTTADDLALFCKSVENHYSDNFMSFDLKGSKLNERKIYRKKDIDYSDIIIEFNNEKYIMYKDYLSKRVWTHPKLNVFVERNFIPNDEYNYKKAHYLTIVAIFSSIILSIFSIFLSLRLDSSNTVFWKSNEAIENALMKDELKMLTDISNLVEEQNIEISDIRIIIEENHQNLESLEYLVDLVNKIHQEQVEQNK